MTEIKQICSEKFVNKYLRTALETVLGTLEAPVTLADEVLEIATTYRDLEDYEKQVHDLFERNRITERYVRYHEWYERRARHAPDI